MATVENFAALPLSEQRKFAEALLKTINSERIFHDDTNFELTGIEVDDISGGINILVSHTDPIAVERHATWVCERSDNPEDDPGNDADYENYFLVDAKNAFKTASTVIDGYKVSLIVSDVDKDDTIDAEVEVENVSDEDDGIGSYEYFGFTGYDSRPYLAVEGTVTCYCECVLAFYVEPNDVLEV